MGTQNEHQRKVEVSQIMECSRSQAPLELAVVLLKSRQTKTRREKEEGWDLSSCLVS